MENLKPGDEIIVKDYPMTLIVVGIGEKNVRCRVGRFDWIISVPKDKIIWKSGKKSMEEVEKSLKGLSGYETMVVMRKKKKLSEVM